MKIKTINATREILEGKKKQPQALNPVDLEGAFDLLAKLTDQGAAQGELKGFISYSTEVAGKVKKTLTNGKVIDVDAMIPGPDKAFVITVTECKAGDVPTSEPEPVKPAEGEGAADEEDPEGGE